MSWGGGMFDFDSDLARLAALAIIMCGLLCIAAVVF